MGAKVLIESHITLPSQPGIRLWLARGSAAALACSALVATGAGAAAAGPVTIAVACDEVGLENAITTANASATGAVLNLTSHCTYTLTDVDNNGTQGPNGLPVVTNLITVNGWGATITPGWPAPPIRILELEAGANVVLNNLTVDGGHAAYGGGLYVGDGAVLALNHVTLSHNVAGGTPGTGVGGGVYIGLNGGSGGGTLSVTNSVVRDNSGVEGGGFANLGTVIVKGSEIENNSATCSSFDCGGIAQAGGIFNLASFSLQNSTVESNTASCMLDGCFAEGGGIASTGTFAGGLVLQHTAVSNNMATCSGASCQIEGGGIWAYGTTVLSNSPVHGNTGTCSGPGCMAWGGGIVNSGFGTMTLANKSTVTGNTATAPGGTAYGGGLYNDYYSATLHLIGGSNVEHNTASALFGTPSGGGIYDANPASGSVTLTQSVVKYNKPDQCGGTAIQGC